MYTYLCSPTYVHSCTLMYTYVPTYVHSCTLMYLPMYTHVHSCTYLCTLMYTHVHSCTLMYLPMYTHVHLCTYLCTLMYTHVPFFFPTFTIIRALGLNTSILYGIDKNVRVHDDKTISNNVLIISYYLEINMRFNGS